MPDDKTDISHDLGHEPIAVSARAVAYALAILFATVVASLLLMAGFKAFLSATRRVEPTVGSPGPPIAPPPGVPELGANQRGELLQLRSRETELLTEYAWVDRDAGVARIPIRRAMEILSQEDDSTPDVQNDNPDSQ